jgi:hypothetical protein
MSTEKQYKDLLNVVERMRDWQRIRDKIKILTRPDYQRLKILEGTVDKMIRETKMSQATMQETSTTKS